MIMGFHWFEQQRARGICYICKQKMDDTDRKLAHTKCKTLVNQGKKVKEIRKILLTSANV